MVAVSCRLLIFLIFLFLDCPGDFVLSPPPSSSMASPVCKKRKCTAKSHGCPRYHTRSFVREQNQFVPTSKSVGPFIGRLPVEMLTNILSYLDAPSLACFGSSCKTLRSYCDQMWRPLCSHLCLQRPPTILCVAKPSRMNSIYSYDNAVELCISQRRYKISAIRNWLYSRWRCVICYRNGSQRVNRHSVTLCETCHPLFYRRKCHAKVLVSK